MAKTTRVTQELTSAEFIDLSKAWEAGQSLPELLALELGLKDPQVWRLGSVCDVCDGPPTLLSRTTVGWPPPATSTAPASEPSTPSSAQLFPAGSFSDP